MQRDWYIKIIRQHCPLSANVRALVGAANADLVFGPLSVDEQMRNGQRYPGFHGACEQIREALADVGELWVDRDSDCVSDREPEGKQIDGEWCEPGGEWWHLERRDVLRALVGRELAHYVA